MGADLSFEAGVIFFSRTLRLFHSLNEADLDDVSHQTLASLLPIAEKTLKQVQQIREFSLQKYPENPIAVRDQLIAGVRDHYDTVFHQVAPVLAFAVRKGTDFKRLEEQAKEALKKIEDRSIEHEVSLTSARTNAEELVREVRKIAQEAGVSQHAIHFKEEADGQEQSASQWLKATVLLALLTLIVGVAFLIAYFDRIGALTPSQGLQLAISKIVVFSVLLSATFWAGRTYRAHCHNAVINRHRQNALATFQTFAKAAGSDDQIRNAVLLQATQCIFSPQQTGYVPGESEGGGIHQVLEIVRGFGPKSG
ncbi:MAG: hypothetical protein WD733_06030 [Bryobacterales bacterium]